MRKAFITIMALGMAAAAMAVPAKRVKRTITLDDGRRIEATLTGDEFLSYYMADNGERYVKNADDTYSLLQEGRIKRAEARRTQATQVRLNRRKLAPHKASWGAESNPVTGTKRGIVILVNFKDKKMTNTQKEFNDYFNKVGYNNAGMSGSVHDYFLTSSYGKFDLEFDVVGPYTLSQNMAYYGGNDDDGNDLHPGQMVCEAIRLADKDVDFSQYDWDGDKEVEQVYVIYAGNGEAQGAPANTVWPHEWELSSTKQYNDGEGAITTDGVTIDTYATSNECRGKNSTKIDGIGTACHEFSHCMAIPDFYDTSDSGYFGMDAWSVMDYGSYNGADGCGESPWTYTSYERMYSGWLTPTILSEGANININDMKPLNQAPEAYLLRNPSNRNDYYLLENRQLTGFDKYGYGHGLLILHVQFDGNEWAANNVNSTSKQRMTIVPADGNLKSIANGASYLAGDPFPGSKNKTQTTILGKSIDQISENRTSGTISFLFDGGKKLPTPQPTTQSTTTDGFSIAWPAVEGATSYLVRLIADDGQGVDAQDAVLLDEGFSKFNNGKTTDGSTDISGKLDNYTSTTGWRGTKIFTSTNKGAKLGSSQAAGSISTPTLSSSTGSVTVKVALTNYNNDNSSVSIKCGNTLLGTFTPTGTEGVFVCSGTSGTDFKVTASGTKRFYISGLTIYDGEFTADDLAANAPLKAKTKSEFTTHDTSYTFTGLNTNFTYSYLVCAVSDDAQSQWSGVSKVTLGGETGIGNTMYDSTNSNSAVYDLSGRRVKAAAKGIFIMNGKKVIK